MRPSKLNGRKGGDAVKVMLVPWAAGRDRVSPSRLRKIHNVSAHNVSSEFVSMFDEAQAERACADFPPIHQNILANIMSISIMNGPCGTRPTTTNAMRPRITYLAALAPEEPQPNVEETFAGALALMTAHAEAADGERAAIASAVSAHLVRIASVACTSAECRLALAVLAAHWAAISEDGVDVPQDVLLWHVAPAAVQ